jgi:hypothetical protein
MAGKGGKGGGSAAPGVTPVVNAVDEMRSRLYDFVPTATEVIDTEPVIETQPTSEIATVLKVEQILWEIHLQLLIQLILLI